MCVVVKNTEAREEVPRTRRALASWGAARPEREHAPAQQQYQLVSRESRTVACSPQAPWLGQRWEVMPAARSRELRRMGWPGRLGANEAAGSRGLPAGFNSPKVHGSTAGF